MFNCLGQLYSETIQICSGVLFILLEMNAWGNNAQVCKQSRHGSQKGGRSPLLTQDAFHQLFVSLSLFHCVRMLLILGNPVKF